MEILHRKLADLNLSIRTKNILKNAGIETLQDLTTYTKSDLIKFRNFGKRSIMELEELMLSNNLNFGMGQTIKSDNTETLTNALHQIEKLEEDKADLLNHLQEEINEFSVLGYEPSQYQLGYNSAINDIMEILKPTDRIKTEK